MGSFRVGSAFSTIITSTKVEMTDSDKHSSLLRNVIDYGPNFFIVEAIWVFVHELLALQPNIIHNNMGCTKHPSLFIPSPMTQKKVLKGSNLTIWRRRSQ